MSFFGHKVISFCPLFVKNALHYHLTYQLKKQQAETFCSPFTYPHPACLIILSNSLIFKQF
jgi:hypothetical protein